MRNERTRMVHLVGNTIIYNSKEKKIKIKYFKKGNEKVRKSYKIISLLSVINVVGHNFFEGWKRKVSLILRWRVEIKGVGGRKNQRVK